MKNYLNTINIAMKNNLLILFLLFPFLKSYSQTFINGDFENNTLTTCNYNLADTIFNMKISNVYAFGKTNFFGYFGETDIQTVGCYVTPQNGNWCIGLASDYITYTTSDAIAIELTSNLIVGQNYQLTFYLFGNTSFVSTLTKAKIGASLNDTTFGVLIDSIAPIANVWKPVMLNFIASQPSQYITVKNMPGIAAWNQIDNFSIMTTTGIGEQQSSNSKVSIYPNPFTQSTTINFEEEQKNITIKIMNLSGNEFKSVNFTGKQLVIDKEEMKAGIYFVQTIDEKKKVTNNKLVIQ